jgi:hypothetical protein
MSSIREKARAKSAVKEKVVQVPEWDCSVLVRGMTTLSRSECRAVFTDDGRATPKQNAAFLAALVISHCFDPETCKPAFDAADADWLIQSNPTVIDNLVNEINILSGYGAKDPVSEAVKNSETTSTSETSSN